jgi:hypothetical protein
MRISKWAKSILFIVFFLFIALQITETLEARYPSSGDEACGTACGSFIFIIVAIFVLNIALWCGLPKMQKTGE